ncbi:MAG: hypothetical protein ACJ73E_05285 [Mycobacteriales bacterium]
MSSDLASRSPVQVNRRLLLGGGVLLGIGGALWLAGAVVTAAAVADATRRWIRGWEMPPREVARRRWGQVRSSASAGAQAWRQDGVAAARREPAVSDS